MQDDQRPIPPQLPSQSPVDQPTWITIPPSTPLQVNRDQKCPFVFPQMKFKV